jgi:hypothetical protein
VDFNYKKIGFEKEIGLMLLKINTRKALESSFVTDN